MGQFSLKLERITAEEYKALQARQPSKYRSRKERCAQAHRHDSVKEAQRCNALTLMQMAGEIRDLVNQPRFKLIITRDGKAHKITSYVGDFRYTTRDGRTVVEDVKSSYTAKLRLYIIKKRLMLAIEGIEIQEVQ